MWAIFRCISHTKESTPPQMMVLVYVITLYFTCNLSHRSMQINIKSTWWAKKNYRFQVCSIHVSTLCSSHSCQSPILLCSDLIPTINQNALQMTNISDHLTTNFLLQFHTLLAINWIVVWITLWPVSQFDKFQYVAILRECVWWKLFLV